MLPHQSYLIPTIQCKQAPTCYINYYTVLHHSLGNNYWCQLSTAFDFRVRMGSLCLGRLSLGSVYILVLIFIYILIARPSGAEERKFAHGCCVL